MMEFIFLALVAFEFVLLVAMAALTIKVTSEYRRIEDTHHYILRRIARMEDGEPAPDDRDQLRDRNKRIEAGNRRAFEKFGGGEEGT